MEEKDAKRFSRRAYWRILASFKAGKEYLKIGKYNIPFTDREISFDYTLNVKAGVRDLTNIKYDFDITEEKDILYLHEIWKDQEALTAHGQMEHYATLSKPKAEYVIDTIIEKEEI